MTAQASGGTSDRRFEYLRPSPEELRQMFLMLEQEKGISTATFARLFGLRMTLIKDWQLGRRGKDCPVWVPVAIAMLRGSDKAIVSARRMVATLIVRDNWEPARGEFPYLREPDGTD